MCFFTNRRPIAQGSPDIEKAVTLRPMPFLEKKRQKKAVARLRKVRLLSEKL